MNNLGLDQSSPQFNFETMRLSRKRRPNRSQSAITLSILDACRTPCLQHWLMVKTRLGYNSFVNHVDRLVDEGMIKVMTDKNRLFYSLTSQGISFLDRLTEKLAETDKL